MWWVFLVKFTSYLGIAQLSMSYCLATVKLEVWSLCQFEYSWYYSWAIAYTVVVADQLFISSPFIGFKKNLLVLYCMVQDAK
jgi:hypothetical protein